MSSESEEFHPYEHVNPALVGNHRHFVVSEIAGRSLIIQKLRELRAEGRPIGEYGYPPIPDLANQLG
jgi:hypothetical protein